MATFIPNTKFTNENAAIYFNEPEYKGTKYVFGFYYPATDTLVLSPDGKATIVVHPSKWLLQLDGGAWLVGKNGDVPFDTKTEAEAVAAEKFKDRSVEPRRLFAPEDVV